METFSPKGHLKEFTQRTKAFLVNDLKAIPAEKQNTCPGGCAHTALYMVAECAAVNSMIAKTLRGEEVNRPPQAEREAFLKSFDSETKALAFLEQETENLLAAIDTLDENTLAERVQTPIGERSRYGLAEIPAFHMGYHDGQLNYIHTLHDDHEMHW